MTGLRLIQLISIGFRIPIFIFLVFAGFFFAKETWLETIQPFIANNWLAFEQSLAYEFIVGIATVIYTLFKGVLSFGWIPAIIAIAVLAPFWGWAFHLLEYILTAVIVGIFWVPAIALIVIGWSIKLSEIFCGIPLGSKYFLKAGRSMVPWLKGFSYRVAEAAIETAERRQVQADKNFKEAQATAMVLGMSTINRNIEEMNEKLGKR